MQAIDVFAGCGGMTYGLRDAGFEVTGAIEVDATVAAVYRLNHPATQLLEADVVGVDAGTWMRQLGLQPGELDLMAGCPPCQGFSRLRTLNGARSNRDSRNGLVMEMARLVQAFRPRAVLMENVPALERKRVFAKFVRLLRQEGYEPNWAVLDAGRYGVPQRRKRLVLVAGRGFEIPLAPTAASVKTVRMAIGGLPAAGASGDYLHDMPENRSRAMRQWIAAVPKDGGSRTDLPPEMQRACHQRSDGFRDVYGRMAWDAPAPTITGGCLNPSKGRFLHPEENRNISMREAALLQTLPPTFRVPVGTTKTAAAQMIGNALPPEFVKRHALAVRDVLSVRNCGGDPR